MRCISRFVIMLGFLASPAFANGALGGGFLEFLLTGGVDNHTQEAPLQESIPPQFLRQEVDYTGPAKPGTIVVDTAHCFLYLVEPGGRALRYGVGVARPGFAWAGVKAIAYKAEWPDWTPPQAMLNRRPDLPVHMLGGPDNPLGARALYLGASEYRIHGTNEPSSIGQHMSSGCIRMMNEDVIDLYERVHVGTKVIVI